MGKIVRYVGLDVHKETIAIAVADGRREPARLLAIVPHDWVRLIRQLEVLGPSSRLRLCYEAGPTGFELARRLNEQGYCCIVVAPSLVPTRPGERVKTDRRDAVKLAHFLRSGDLRAVTVPEEEVEAVRDLERARDAAKRSERVARQQLDKFLLRQGRRYSGQTRWTDAHWRWIRGQEFSQEAWRRVRDGCIQAVEEASERVERLTQTLAEIVEGSTLAPLVQALQALRGVQMLTAVTLAAELGTFARFENPRQLMAYVGLVPSEHSSGKSRRQGGITRCGNGHARRALVEAAWAYQFVPRMTKAIKGRQRGLPEAVCAIAWKAQGRLHRRYQRLLSRGKRPQQAVTAVARELLGFVWAIAREVQVAG